MASKSNTLEVRLKFLADRLDVIKDSIKDLESLKKEAVSVGTILKGVLSADTMHMAARQFASVLQELKGTIDLGGELSDLSANTGQSVSDLVLLRQAFQNAGMGAASTGQMVNLLQKALTGVNELGESTTGVFEKLGLSISDLKGKSVVEQLAGISAAIVRVDNAADRTRAAMGLFGRSGAQMLALLSDASALETAKKQVGSLGATMEENAEVFDRLGDSWDAMALRADQLFAGVAEKIAPMMQNITDSTNNLDLTEMGRGIGDLTNSLVGFLRVLTPIAAMIGGGMLAKGIASVGKAVAGSVLGMRGATVGAWGLAVGAAAGLGIGYYIQHDVLNWAASIGSGGASSEADIAAAQARAGSSSIADLIGKWKSLKNADDVNALEGEAMAMRQNLYRSKIGLGWNQTAEKNAIDGDIAAIERFLEKLRSLDVAKLEKDYADREAEATSEKIRRNVFQKQASDRAFDAQVSALAKSQAYGRMSPEDQLKEVNAKLASLEGSKINLAVGSEDLAQAEKDILRLLGLQDQLKEKIKAKNDAAAEKRENLNLELQIAEAQAAGNDALVERLKWQRDYVGLLKQAEAVNMEDPWGFAIRGANAAMGSKEKGEEAQVQMPGFDTSNLGMWQTAALAAEAAKARPKADKLDDVARNTAVANGKLDMIVDAINGKEAGVFV